MKTYDTFKLMIEEMEEWFDGWQSIIVLYGSHGDVVNDDESR